MQYLFNAPEGYARLVLEHKTRPSAKLRALFAVQPQALVRRHPCRTRLSLNDSASMCGFKAADTFN